MKKMYVVSTIENDFNFVVMAISPEHAIEIVKHHMSKSANFSWIAYITDNDDIWED